MIILYLSLVNLNNNETLKELLFPYSDKIAHFGIYAIFSFLMFSEYNKKRKQWLPLSISIFYGILMEFLQFSFTTYRSLEIFDMLANTIGAFAAWYIYKKIFLQI